MKGRREEREEYLLFFLFSVSFLDKRKKTEKGKNGKCNVT
jgi:hypothetical protein